MSRSRRTTALDTLKLELNAARAPISAPGPGVPVQLALQWKPVRVLGELFLIHELAGVLRPPDLLAFAHLCSRYLIDRPDDRQVRVSLAEVSGWLGSTHRGGTQIRQAAESIRRLAGCSFESVMRLPGRSAESAMRLGGRWTGTERVRGWHLVDEYTFVRQGATKGRVMLSRVMAERLDSGSFVMLDRALLEQLVDRSGMAARLWVFLEGERLNTTMRWALFSGPECAPDRERPNPAIADLLRTNAARRRRQVAADIRAACRIIEEADPLYHLAVDRAAEPGMWIMSAIRDAKRPPVAPRERGIGRDANTASGMRQTRHPLGRFSASGVTSAHSSEGGAFERANTASGVTRVTPSVELLRRGVSIEGVPLSGDVVTSHPSPVKVMPKRHDDTDDRIARARAAAADATKSDAVREAARAELGRLGAQR